MKILKLTQKQTAIVTLIVLIALFLGVCLLLTFLGSRVYTGHAAYERQQEESRAGIYFTNRLRQCENSSQVRIASLGGKIPALVITESSLSGNEQDSDDEAEQEVWYYHYDGELCRAEVKAGESISPEDGSGVMPLQSADFRFIKDGLLEISTTTADGESNTLNFCLANGGASK